MNLLCACVPYSIFGLWSGPNPDVLLAYHRPHCESPYPDFFKELDHPLTYLQCHVSNEMSISDENLCVASADWRPVKQI